MPHLPASDALSHIKVLDVTRVRSGPTAVRQLGDWGADVIKVEQPEALEPDGALGAGRRTPDFQNLHRNKRSLTLDLKDPKGLALFLRLVEGADVVVENFRPDVKDRLGIDYERLAAVNPRIILASISGFGQDGPYARRPGFDQVAQGMGGLMWVTGEPGRGPMRAGIPVADLTAGLFCALGILVALVEREKSGRGQWIQTSLLQAQIFMLDFQAARWLMASDLPEQAGNNHPTSVPTGVFQTADGAINLAVAGDDIWRRFAEAVGKPEWLDMQEYRDNDGRLARRDALNAEIAGIFRTRSSHEWVALLTEKDVPCGEIYHIDEIFEDPQVQHLGIAQELDTVPYGPTRFLAQPVELTRTPCRLARRPPERSEDSDEILGALGLSPEEIAKLRAANIV